MSHLATQGYIKQQHTDSQHVLDGYRWGWVLDGFPVDLVDGFFLNGQLPQSTFLNNTPKAIGSCEW